MAYYLVGVLIALDVLLNAVLGGDHYTTVSCRVGESIQAGGWASKVPWPYFLKAHFINAVYTTTV